jgi:hypothetical protein
VSYSIQVVVWDDDYDAAEQRWVLNNTEDRLEAIEYARDVCAQEYERTGIEPMQIGGDYP